MPRRGEPAGDRADIALDALLEAHAAGARRQALHSSGDGYPGLLPDEALRRSEEHLRAALVQAAIGMALIGPRRPSGLQPDGGEPTGEAEKTSSPLTRREHQILRLLADGMTNEKAAAALGISAETVQSHVRNTMKKLGADTRTQAVATALRRSFIA